MLLSGTLRKLGHEVIVAADGSEAWEHYRANPVAVVITDWMMPNSDGLELCRRIREQDRSDYTYILILTALSGKGRFLEAMDAGADDYVTKPFDPDELAARLRVAERIIGLKEEVARLECLLPICSYCKRIRSDDDRWTNVERYVTTRTELEFTHSICPGCYESRIEGDLRSISGGAG